MSASTSDPAELLAELRRGAAVAAARRSARDLPIPGRDLAGVHFAMEFLPQQNRRVGAGAAARQSHPILAGGKHVVVDRRRRYRLGLHRHLDPPGRAVGDAARDHAEAAGEGGQGADLAELAAEAPDLVQPSGRRRARLLRGDAEILGRERRGEEAALRARRRQDGSRSPAPNSCSRPIWCCSPWASCIPVHEGMLAEPRRQARPARQCRGQRQRLSHQRRQGVRRRRHAPRPVAGGLGDPRRPAGGARDRRVR